MASSTMLFLMQLLLLTSLASAGHFYGGTTTFTNRGRNPDGTFTVDIRFRGTYDWCIYPNWRCYSGNCGNEVSTQRGRIDSSANGQSSYYNQWCETETVMTRVVPNNRPFQMREASCCWIPTLNNVGSWRLLTQVDLGTRSDTGEPNRSPDVAIIPLLRPIEYVEPYKPSYIEKILAYVQSISKTLPEPGETYAAFTWIQVDGRRQTGYYFNGREQDDQIRVRRNCPRTYNLMTFDPDGDQVLCRYGTARGTECNRCNQPSGFHLNEGSCTLRYNFASGTGVYGFEMVVEDFPRSHITLAYTDGSQSGRSPLSARRRRRSLYNPYYLTTIPPRTTTYSSTTTSAPSTTTYAPITTTVSPTTTYAPTTTSAPSTTTYAPITTTVSPTTTYAPTTTSAPSTTTYAPTTTTVSPTTTYAPTTTSAPSTTTYAPTTTTTPWWWRTTTPITTTTTATTSTSAPWSTWRTTTTARPTTSGRLYPSTAPLSKLPLQFSLLVDPPAPSCRDGEYFPKFLHPTPRDGERLQAEVRRELEIRVKAQATHSTVHDVIFSGPLNSTKHRTTHNEFVIKWTPVQDDLGNYFPICFVAESATGSPLPTVRHHRPHVTASAYSDVYQSEMRCVIVEVVQQLIEAHVICEETTMRVEVDKSSFRRLHQNYFQLNDPSNVVCSLQTHSNSTHIIAVFPLNTCGTQIEEDNDYLTFKNKITSVENVNDVITRRHLVDVEFCCQYKKRGNVTLSFFAHRNNVTVKEKGFGTFTYQFEFFHNDHFHARIDPNSYPLEFDVGDQIYMQIDATSSLNDTELFVESCSAAPYDSPNFFPMYPIIENGCNVDPTVEVFSARHKKYFRFGMEAFKFIGLYDQVYVSCSVIVCEAGNPDTRCSQGCTNSTSAYRRRRREAIIQTASHFISQGPLRLRKASETKVTNLNMNLMFITGCLLAAVGMICAAVIYKTNTSRIKYQPLQSVER